MSSERDTLVTQAGLDALQAELDELVNVKRVEMAARIKSARELGDLKENAEYHDAKNSQAFLETKIIQIEAKIRTARVIKSVDSSKVSVGTRVTVRDVESKEDIDYTITGTAEADPLENRVSNESPIGMALLGHKPGDVVEVTLPRGSLKLEVCNIETA